MGSEQHFVTDQPQHHLAPPISGPQRPYSPAAVSMPRFGSHVLSSLWQSCPWGERLKGTASCSFLSVNLPEWAVTLLHYGRHLATGRADRKSNVQAPCVAGQSLEVSA